MQKHSIFHVLLASLLLVSCSVAAPASTPVKEDEQSSAITAIPTNTRESTSTDTASPPTSTITETPAPTLTLEPTFTLAPTETATPTKIPCNQPLTSWKAPTTSFSILNETKPQGKIILSMSVLTSLGECGYLIINDSSFTGPVGSYSAFAYVTGDKNFTVSGSFIIRDVPYKIIIRNDKIVEAYSCHPHC